MKKSFVFLAAAAMLIAGCRQASSPAVEGQVVDATIYSVTVETAEGDTLTVSTRGTDPLLVPGVLPGDGVRIAYEVLPDETLRALELDITVPSAYRLVPGIWRDCSSADEVGLVLAEDGSAQAVGLQGPALQTWALDGESLVLTAADPDNARISVTRVFRIEKLDADSLVVAPTDAGMRRLAFSRQP